MSCGNVEIWAPSDTTEVQHEKELKKLNETEKLLSQDLIGLYSSYTGISDAWWLSFRKDQPGHE